MNAHVISISNAIELGMSVSGSKEYLYPKCDGCVHCYFAVAIGLHHRYGWYVQRCNSLPNCSPLYKSVQLSLLL